MPKKFKFRYVNEIVGGFVVLVFLLLLAGVIIAGRAQNWFETMYEINLKFPPEGSLDLQKGAEVMLLGTKVGSVQDILVDEAGNLSGVMRVRGPFAKRFLREDSIGLVKKKMVVAGDAYIELTRGTGAELPRAGGEIRCVKDTELIKMLEEALESIRREATNTLALVNGAIAEYTELAAGMNDPQGNLQQLLANANGLLEDIRRGSGLPAKLLNDPEVAGNAAQIVANALALAEKLNALAAEIQALVAKLSPAAEALASEAENLPVVVGDAQNLMRETTVLLDGLQKHWLLRKYMAADDAWRAEEVLVP